MKNNELYQLYTTWWENRSPDELTLHYKILEYEEEYFEDMRFEPSSILKDYLVFLYDGYDCENSFDLNLGLEDYYYRYNIESLEDDAGIHNKEERSIKIDPEHIEDKTVILHEMIHAHENIVNAAYPFLRDILLLSLYNLLKDRIDDLDDRIKAHAHVISGENIYNLGGNHDVLFYLKSLDLDLRCDYKLGTICGYGREKY